MTPTMNTLAVCLIAISAFTSVQGFFHKYGYGQGYYGFDDMGYAPSFGNLYGPAMYGLNYGYNGLLGMGGHLGLGYGDQFGYGGHYGLNFGYGHMPFYRRHYYKRPYFSKKGYY